MATPSKTASPPATSDEIVILPRVPQPPPRLLTFPSPDISLPFQYVFLTLDGTDSGVSNGVVSGSSAIKKVAAPFRFVRFSNLQATFFPRGPSIDTPLTIEAVWAGNTRGVSSSSFLSVPGAEVLVLGGQRPSKVTFACPLDEFRPIVKDETTWSNLPTLFLNLTPEPSAVALKTAGKTPPHLVSVVIRGTLSCSSFDLPPSQ